MDISFAHSNYQNPTEAFDRDCHASFLGGNNLLGIASLDLLDAGRLTKFTTGISHNLSVLVTSGLEELSADGGDKGETVVASHRNAVHAYAYFLSVIHEYLHNRLLDSQKAEASAKGAAPKKRGGKAKKAVQEDPGNESAVDWPAIMERIMRALGRTLKANLDEILYRSPADKCRLAEVCVLTAARCLEDSSITKQTASTKQKATLAACLDVVVLSATRHANANGCLDLVGEALFRLVKEHDHGPDLAVQAAALAASQHDSLSLGKKLVMKFCEVEPEGYDEMASHDTKPVKRAAEMLSGMAAALSDVLHASIGQLMPYFGCKTAVTIRSNLVECMGHLMKSYMACGMNEKGSRPLQMSRQNVAQNLVARVNDMHALVSREPKLPRQEANNAVQSSIATLNMLGERKTALNTIEALAERNCWPIEYVVLAAKSAVARLDDGALAAGAALGLLCKLVHITAKTQLTDAFLVGSLNRFEEDLKPDVVEDGQEDAQDSDPHWEAGALGGGETQAAGPDGQQDIIMPTQLDDGAGSGPPPQPDPHDNNNGGAGARGNMTYSQVRLLIATLKELLELSRALAAALPEVEALLTSDSADVAEKAIQLLTLCSQKQLQGVADSWRRVWHLVFSTSEKVRETVLDAFCNFLLPASIAGASTQKQQNACIVLKLTQMVDNLALCDQEALEELMRLAITGIAPGQSPVFGPDIVRIMLENMKAAIIQATLLEREGVSAAKEARQSRIMAGRLSLLCGMVARHAPELVVHDVENLILHLKRSHTILKDPLLVRNLALILRDIAGALHAAPKGGLACGSKYQPANHIPNALANLVSILVSGHLPQHGSAWPPAAQAATAAIYQLHPEPHTLLWPLVQHLAAELVGGRASATQIARAVYLVGCIATQQLALLDTLTKRVREERAAQEKKAAEQASANDMDAQLGTGQARDAQLDALHDDLAARLMGDGLINMWGKLVSELCHNPSLLALHPDLASAAMTTLAKFMALSVTYCEDNCPVFFTRLSGGNVKLAPEVRCGMLVALGDLVRRHPNVVEPWTERIFMCLKDENEEVAKTCLCILAHLILSGMTKSRGHMPHVARCLVAPNPALRDLTIRLFNSMSKKQAKGGQNDVFKNLADIISSLTRGDPITEEDFRTMMQRLLGYVKADKLADKLKERLCERFQNVVCEFATSAQAPAMSAEAGDTAPSGGIGAVAGPTSSSGNSYDAVVREWRFLADCIALIPYSEKGLHTYMESLRCYKHALGDEHVYQVFKGIAEHARRGNRTAEFKQEVAEYEARLMEAHMSLREEQMQQAAAAAEAAKAAKAAKDAAAAKAAAAAEAATHSSNQDGATQQAAQQGDTTGEAQGGDKMADELAGAGDGMQQNLGTALADTGDTVSDALVSGVGEDFNRRGDDGMTEGAGHVIASTSGGDDDAGGDDEDMASAGEYTEGVDEEEDNGNCDDEGDGLEPREGATHAHTGPKANNDEPITPRAEDELDEHAEDDEENGDDEGAFTDAEMEWNEDSTEGNPATPLGDISVELNREHAAPAPSSSVSGTPMAITPLPLAFVRNLNERPPADAMAWSPGPSCTTSNTAPSAVPAGSRVQENANPAFAGFRIKPDPDVPKGAMQGVVWPMGGVIGVRIKPDPDGPSARSALWRCSYAPPMFAKTTQSSC
ncbi:hypothetical protein VOLCADRAFT_104588 [Volvox carteri f. nagariensis]|uniref:Condensin complex subunit 1 n=1 Tax=Volvox carteri f. nagariensis TaxID=3068 RepID=D8TUN7_VOLCA|nr:uncharacterized protein VOLCADRAFT_104588 [Volvox carteri f. nagariensis]EFJ48856.1 hypothetical protein VOLCADRAFT_104588 [Volvox carteri f. nagariensis]|eukprot:XP_002950188.1 hypothetical protein VOLCADRAFT_104588 [Volvox carteri f. nagariensis]